MTTDAIPTTRAKRRAGRLLIPIAAAALVLAPGALAAQPVAETPPEAPAPAAEPTPAAQPPAAPSASAPAASTAQEDTSGGNEYQESGPPTGTGEPQQPQAPSAPPSDPAPSAPSAPSGGSAPAAESSAAGTDAGVAQTGSQLPRTGADSWPVALVALVLLALGVALRRSAAATRVG